MRRLYPNSTQSNPFKQPTVEKRRRSPYMQYKYQVPHRKHVPRQRVRKLQFPAAIVFSVLLHVAGFLCVGILLTILMLLPKTTLFQDTHPPLEFVLVPNKQKPLNEETHNRSTQDSRAGGMEQRNIQEDVQQRPSLPSKPEVSHQQVQPKPQPQKQKKTTTKPKVTQPPKVARVQQKRPVSGAINLPVPQHAEKLPLPMSTSQAITHTQETVPRNAFRPASVASAPKPITLASSNVGIGTAGLDAKADVNFGPYMQQVVRQIKRHWVPPKQRQSKTVVVLFRLQKDGSLVSVKIKKPSQEPALDRSAIEAIRRSAPFGHFPIGANKENVDIEFTFDYNLFVKKRRFPFQ